MIAIYARQSIDRPDSVSIEAQIEQCKKLAHGEVWVYSDSGYSGKNVNRPEFERMLQDIKDQKISSVISYRLDRVSRNITDFANLLKLFEDTGVNYISATEQFDTSSPIGRAMIYIVMVFAQLERETIATRIADNYRFRATKGLFMGGNTPFGYDSKQMILDGRKVSILEPNEQADLLRHIYDKFSSKESLVSIAHELNRSGIATAKGNTWSGQAVRRVLENISPCCADEKIHNYLIACGYNISNVLDDFDGTHGMCLFFKQKNRNQSTETSEQVATVGLHKPLISSDQYIRVQRILSQNAPARGKRSSRTFLAGLIKCKECGHSFGVKYTNKGGKEYAYYRCRGRESRGVCSNDIYIPALDLEEVVMRQCKAHSAARSSSQITVAADDISKSSVEVESLKEQIQNLIDNVGKGNAMIDDLLTQKIITLQNQIDAIASEVKTPSVQKADNKTFEWVSKELERFDLLNIQQKSEVARSIVSEIKIDHLGRVELAYLI